VFRVLQHLASRKTDCVDRDGPLPVLTTFLPSLPQGSPFRVSIHAWDTPKLSPNAEALKNAGEKVHIGVRIQVDGRCVASVSSSVLGLANGSF
jgi:hypothetical protein